MLPSLLERTFHPLFLLIQHTRTAFGSPPQFHQLTFYNDEHDNSFTVTMLYVEMHWVVIVAVNRKTRTMYSYNLGIVPKVADAPDNLHIHPILPPPTSNIALVNSPSEHYFVASIGTANIFSFLMAACSSAWIAFLLSSAYADFTFSTVAICACFPSLTTGLPIRDQTYSRINPMGKPKGPPWSPLRINLCGVGIW